MCPVFWQLKHVSSLYLHVLGSCFAPHLKHFLPSGPFLLCTFSDQAYYYLDSWPLKWRLYLLSLLICAEVAKVEGDRGKNISVDGHEPETRTIFQYYRCKWHGCPCQKERNSLDEERYFNTIDLEKKMKEQFFNLVSVWECENLS